MRVLIPPPQIYAAICLTGLVTLGCSGGSGSGSTSAGNPAATTLTAPAITSQPQNQVAVAGASATFSVTATGTPAPSYQWQMAGAPLPGQTSAQLVLNNLAAANEGSYQVVVTNSAGTVTSIPATLSVNRPPSFSQQPAPQTVTAPAAASFSVIVDAEPTPALQWQTSPDGNTWTNLPEATATTVSTGATSSVANGLQYRCQASNTLGSATSSAATLTVNSVTPPAPPPAGSYSLTVTLGAGTTGTPASGANYTAGSVVTYAYTAMAGYQNLQVTLDGAAAPASGSLTMNANHALAATASAIPASSYTVSFVAGSGGTLTGAATQTVTAGASTSAVTAVADSGSSFQNWTGSGFTTVTSNPLTVTNVQHDLTITANFASLPASYPVTFTAGQGGSITGAASQTVVAGASASAVTAVPASGYVFSDWTGTGFTTSTANPLTVADVQAGLTITAHFTSSNPIGNKVGDAPSDINFVDANGRVSHLSDYQGKVILLVCSEFYCNPCQQESLILQGLANTYGPKGVVILENLSNVGTNVVTAAELTEWATNAGITTVPVLHDSNDVPTLYALTAFPTNILIGKDYTILAIQSGYNQTEVTAMITQGLQ